MITNRLEGVLWTTTATNFWSLAVGAEAGCLLPAELLVVTASDHHSRRRSSSPLGGRDSPRTSLPGLSAAYLHEGVDAKILLATAPYTGDANCPLLLGRATDLSLELPPSKLTASSASCNDNSGVSLLMALVIPGVDLPSVFNN